MARLFGSKNPMWGKFGVNHPTFGRKQSEPAKNKIRLAKLGDKNPLWQKTPTYRAIHLWLLRNRIKPKKCQQCKRITKLDWANVGGYVRDPNKYKALCRSCHFKLDEKLHGRSNKNGRFVKC